MDDNDERNDTIDEIRRCAVFHIVVKEKEGPPF